MTAATALFMIPTAIIFPALLRKANTPPSSSTLCRARKSTPKKGRRWHVYGGSEHGTTEHDRILKAQHEDFHVALSAGKTTRVPCFFLIISFSRGALHGIDGACCVFFPLLLATRSVYLPAASRQLDKGAFGGIGWAETHIRAHPFAKRWGNMRQTVVFCFVLACRSKLVLPRCPIYKLWPIVSATELHQLRR